MHCSLWVWNEARKGRSGENEIEKKGRFVINFEFYWKFSLSAFNPAIFRVQFRKERNVFSWMNWQGDVNNDFFLLHHFLYPLIAFSFLLFKNAYVSVINFVSFLKFHSYVWNFFFSSRIFSCYLECACMSLPIYVLKRMKKNNKLKVNSNKVFRCERESVFLKKWDIWKGIGKEEKRAKKVNAFLNIRLTSGKWLFLTFSFLLFSNEKKNFSSSQVVDISHFTEKKENKIERNKKNTLKRFNSGEM